jgi:TolB-like protein
MMKFLIVIFSFTLGLSSVHAQDAITGKEPHRQPEKSVQIHPPLDERLAELSKQITSKIEAGQKKTIAIVEFTDLQGNVTDFGRYLAEELVTRLYDTEKFRVIERQMLNKVIAEQKLTLTGVVDSASAKQLGKILGVDAIVSGTITNLAESLKVNARLISTQTGEIFAVASTDIFKDESVKGLMTSSGVPRSSDNPQTPSETVKRNLRKVSVRDFVVELQSCRLTMGDVVCDMTIMNAGPVDRTVGFHTRVSVDSKSRLFDEFGREYIIAKTQIGQHVSQNYANMAQNVSNSLVPQVPMRLTLTFDNFTPEAKRASLLRVSFQWINSNTLDLVADFRDVEILK